MSQHQIEALRQSPWDLTKVKKFNRQEAIPILRLCWNRPQSSYLICHSRIRASMNFSSRARKIWIVVWESQLRRTRSHTWCHRLQGMIGVWSMRSSLVRVKMRRRGIWEAIGRVNSSRWASGIQCLWYQAQRFWSPKSSSHKSTLKNLPACQCRSI